ncbi:hypothetical protein BKA69DRAFT_1048619 [Paraphysoderma sedebokerense]|nr:hypothetical protein BKA69DRAFT_1048619 [Paraphysoderma sedebokerense]
MSPANQTKPSKQLSVDSHFKQLQVQMYMHLPPAFVGRAIQGVEQNLNALLCRYNEKVNGVVLSYSNLKFMEKEARIMYDSPFMHFNISCTLLVFSPLVGSRIVGTINKQSTDHIGLLIYNFFNASIPSDKIPKSKFEYLYDNTVLPTATNESKDGEVMRKSNPKKGKAAKFATGTWVNLQTGESLEVGHEIEFEITEIVRANNMISITGSLV